jgi:hypothetical protein
MNGRLGMNGRPLDVEALMRAVVLRNSPPVSRDGLRLAVAFEIRQMVNDSRLLVGLQLGEADDAMEIDIIGLVGSQPIAVEVCLVQAETDEPAKDLEGLKRICAVTPDLLGLALAVRPQGKATNGSGPWQWRNCAAGGSSSWTGFEYAFAWVERGTPPVGPGRPRRAGPASGRGAAQEKV